MALIWFITSLFVLQAQARAGYVYITSMDVPSEVRNASHLTMLDCNYALDSSLDPSETGLVVKWYCNDILVYQWLPQYPPRALSIFKDLLDIRYKMSEDPAKMFRALIITTVTTLMSGDYKCSVATFENEDSMVKKMIVYAPEESMALTLRRIDNENLIAVCSATRVYPEPMISMYILTGNKTKKAVAGVQVETLARTGEYDVKANVLLTVAELETPTEYVCELKLPGTSYKTNRTIIYHSDSSFTRPAILTVGLIGVILMF